MQRFEEVLAEEHEDQQQQEGDRAFAHHDARAALGRHILEGRGDERDVADGVGDEDQEDEGLEEALCHGFLIV